MTANDTTSYKDIDRDELTDKDAGKTLEALVEHGFKIRASSIHIEPHDKFFLVRFRLGNTLRSISKVPQVSLTSLVGQLKIRANLDPIETQKPQEGRYETILGDQTLEVSVSVMPVLGGEKVVMHLSAEDADGGDLERLGFWGEGLSTVRHILAGNYGLILVSGHQRDGISDTLNGLTSLLDNPIAKVARIKFNEPKLADFKKALDEDSNIVTIDRLNDKRTAVLAAGSALKRRMILAGVFADSAIDALGHMRSLGVEPFVLASVTRLGIGQRRLRRLCQSCAERYELDAGEREKLEKDLNLTPTLHRKIYELEKSAQKAGIGALPLSSTSSHITHLWRPSEKGCGKCSGGFNGYTAAVEVLPITNKVQKLLAADKIPTRHNLQKPAEEEGFVPMALDGIVKCLRGQTTIDEVQRA